jgi:hypothetical protein
LKKARVAEGAGSAVSVLVLVVGAGTTALHSKGRRKGFIGSAHTEGTDVIGPAASLGVEGGVFRAITHLSIGRYMIGIHGPLQFFIFMEPMCPR